LRYGMKKLLIALIIILASINNLNASCDWVGNTGSTSSLTVANINECFSEVSGKTGEVTINLSAGTLSISSLFDVNMTNAAFINVTALNIIGAGTIPTGSTKGSAKSTNFTLSNANGLWQITTTSSKKVRISNQNVSGTASGGNAIITIYGNTNPALGGGFRVDHMDLASTNSTTSYRSIWITDAYGVIDHNTYTTNHMMNAVYMINGNTQWATPVKVGTSEMVYIEDNEATKTAGTWPNTMFCDGRNGARIVIRYNTVTNAYFGTHGFDGSDRSVAWYEVYNNTNILEANLLDFSTRLGEARINLRGGTGMFYNNTFTHTHDGVQQTHTGLYEGAILYKYHRLMADYETYAWGKFDYCDSTLRRMCVGPVNHRPTGWRDAGCPDNCANSSGCVDQIYCGECTDDSDCGGTAGQYNYCVYADGTGGYPCRDQPGTLNTHTESTYSNTYQLAHYPSLFWNNTYNGSVVNPAGKESTVEDGIQNDRDYCYHSTTMPATCGGHATTYSAYTYPHPLVNPVADTTNPNDLTSLSPTGQQACATNPSNVAISLSATDNVAVTGVRCCVENGSTCTSATAYASRDVVLSNTSGTTWGATVSSSCDTDIQYNCMSTDGTNYSNNGVISYQMANNSDTTAPTMSTQAIGADGRTVTFTFSEAVTIGAGGSAGFTLTNGDSEEISLTYVSGAGSDTLTYQTSVCVPSTDTFTSGLVYTQPTNGIEDMAGNDLASFSGAGAKTVTNGSGQSCNLATSLFEHGESAPSGSTNASGNAVNLGVKFQTSTAATMTHCWFYKIAADTGTHTCTVYRVLDGSTVGTVDFADESESGWQDQAFASALNIAANEDYIVTVSHPTGNWTSNVDYFASTYTNGNLTATTAGTDYAGRYVYGASMAYPTNDSARNYWTDFTMSYAGVGGPWQCTVSRTGDGCMVTGSQVITDGNTCSATVTLRNGWKATWGGTCPAGSESGGIYTTGNLSADCTLTAACTEQNILP